VEVERLTAVLEATGVTTFAANMQAADRATGGTKDQLKALTEISKVATEALKHVKLTAAQAMESKVSAESILQGVKGIGEEARQAARDLDRVHLSEAQAVETRAVADQQVRALKDVEHQAIKTRAAQGGGGGGGGGMAMGLMGAAIGGGALLGPAAGPGVLGLLAAIPVLATTGAGALGTLFLGFQGVTKAIGGNKKAFDGLEASAKSFVLTVRSLDGWFDKLKQTAGAAMFPGLTAGLKAALSPGTVQAITQAVTAFGQAIGDAGAMFGRYFGSSQFQSIFGPVMQAGAKNFSLMADTALHLFDAMGVLGRAAIPLVGWMVRGVDAASRWADAFVRSKDATGGLSGAMDQAKQSLQLVGNLFGALAKAVYELGAALYPISKVAVKDLTNGLTFLAGVFQRNRQEIQNIVGGALAAFVSMVKGAWPVVSLLAKAIKNVADNIGGWKVAFELILGGVLIAKLAALFKAIKSIGVAIGLLPAEAKTAQLLIDGELVTIGTTAEVTAGKIGGIRAALMGIAGSVVPVVIALSVVNKSNLGQAELDKAGLGFLGHLPVAGNALTQVASIPGVGTTLAMAGAMGPTAYGLLTGAGGTKSQTQTHTTITGPGSGGPHPVGWGQTASIPSVPSIFSGKSTKGESSTLVAALEGISQLYKNAKINVFSGYRSSSQQQGLWDASVKAGHAGFMPNGNPIARPGTSPHESGSAMDGQIMIGGKWVPLSSLPPSVLAKYGLSTVKGDVNHVQLAGGGTDTSIWGPDPPWTTGLGPQTTAKQRAAAARAKAAAAARALSAKLQIPITNDQTLVAHYKSLAASANTGPAIAKYLDDEAAALKKENVDLLASMQGKTAAQDAKIKQTISKNQDTIAGLHKAMVQALDMTKNAASFTKFQAKLKTLAAQFTADSDYATVLVGQTADDYRKVLQKDLLSQAAVLQTEEKSLKSQLSTATGKNKTAIQTRLTSITASLESVQQQILQGLQANVQSLQSKVGTLFANVTQQFDDALGKLFFQNGMKTALEQQLADMQAQDQLSSLTDSIQQAKDQLAQDQTGGLAGVQWDAATGLTKNLYSPGAQKQIDADKKAIDAAQRQLDEYNLGIRAAQERANMDKEYASQVTSLNAKLAKLAEAFQNGTGSMDALRNLAAQYGIVISNVSIPDFLDLSSASGALKLAFMDLVNYIAKITGVTPTIPAGGGGGGGGSAPAGSPAGILQDLHQQVVNGIISPADYYYMISGHKQEIPGMASGGIVRAKPGGTIVRLAEGGQDEEVGPVGRGGGGDVHVHFDGPVYGTNADELARLLTPKIKSELLRDQKRNANTTGIK